MRLVAVISIWIVILGGLALYMQSRYVLSPSPENVYEIQPAPGVYTLEVIPTFDAQGGIDPFGEQLIAKPAFTLLLRGDEIVRHEESMQAAVPTTVTWDTERWPLQVGDNEFFIELPTPQRDEFAVDAEENVEKVYGVRLRLLRDGAEVDSQTLWSEPGKPVKGAMFIKLDSLPGASHEGEHAT